MNTNEDSFNDLQFMTSIDTSIPQNVSMPSQEVKQKQMEQFTIGSPTKATDVESGESTSMPTSMSTSTSTSIFGMSMFEGSAHPVACLFHCLLKSLALVLYLFNGVVFSSNSGANFIIITVGCITLLAMDFWVVKNITGRLLVGLRWWNKVAEDGQTTEWIFESATVTKKNAIDNNVFWTVLYVTPIVWFFLFFTGLVRSNFRWLIIDIFGVVMSGANVYGYWKCSSDQKAKFRRMMARGAEMGTMAALRTNMFGMLNRSSQSQPNTQVNTAATYT